MLKLLITCEHGGNKIPKPYQLLFKPYQKLLKTHRGLDIGALSLSKLIAKQTKAKFIYTDVSRLLIELNRSSHHPHLFSSITKILPNNVKQAILKNYYWPYRDAVETWINKNSRLNKKILHISVHSFTPRLENQVRNNDIGLLYDSRRKEERAICHSWKQNLLEVNSNLLIRYNYPYLGKADGFTSYLRKQFREDNYIGLELEVNQKYFLKKNSSTRKIQEAIILSIQKLLDSYK